MRAALMMLIVIVACIVFVGTVRAAPPCDFKGLSVGDKATPQQIMKHFGVDKYKDSDEEQKTAHGAAAYEKYLERAKKVGLNNAAEEQAFQVGPACGWNHCRIPFGVTVGNRSFPIRVGVFV